MPNNSKERQPANRCLVCAIVVLIWKKSTSPDRKRLLMKEANDANPYSCGWLPHGGNTKARLTMVCGGIACLEFATDGKFPAKIGKVFCKNCFTNEFVCKIPPNRTRSSIDFIDILSLAHKLLLY